MFDKWDRLLIAAAAFVGLMVWADSCEAEDWQVCWQPPTTYENGTPLLEQEITAYTLYIDDTELLTFNAIIGTWCYIITINTPGTYVAEMTVTTENGQTSVRSNQATFTLGPLTPGPVTNLTVTPL